MIISPQKHHREKGKGGRNHHDGASTSSSPSHFNGLFLGAAISLSMSLLALSPTTQARPNLLSSVLHGFHGHASSTHEGRLSVFSKEGDVMEKDFGQTFSQLFNDHSKREGKKETHPNLVYSPCTSGVGSAELQATIANVQLYGVDIDADADTTRSFGLNFKDLSSSSSSSSAFRFLVKSFNGYYSEVECKATLVNEKSNNYDTNTDTADTCPPDFAKTASSSPVLPIFGGTPTDLAKVLKFAESPSSLASAVLHKNFTRSAIFTFVMMAALVVGFIFTRLTSPPKRGRSTRMFRSNQGGPRVCVNHTGKAVRKVDIAGRLLKLPVFASIVLLTVVGNMPTALAAGSITNKSIQQTTNRKHDGTKVDFVILTPEESTVLYADDVPKDTTSKIDAVTRTSGLHLSSKSKEKELLTKSFLDINRHQSTTTQHGRVLGRKTTEPTNEPSAHPSTSNDPSTVPSTSLSPSKEPSGFPTSEPSFLPSQSSAPSSYPSECRNEPDWKVGGSDTLYGGLTCDNIASSDVENLCKKIELIKDSTFEFKRVSQACCVCGGGDHQSSAPSTSYPTMHAYPTSVPSSEPSNCRDEPEWYFDVLDDGTGTKLGCSALDGDAENMCERFGKIEHNHKTAYLACCVCGGGDHQSVFPSKEPSLLPSKEPSTRPSISIEPSNAPSLLPSDQPSELPSSEPSTTPSVSAMPSSVPSYTAFTLLNGEPCHYDAECQGNPFFLSGEESQRRSRMRSTRNRELLENSKSRRTKSKRAKSESPSSQPSSNPTSEPTLEPSREPSRSPSSEPSRQPSDEPSLLPSDEPSLLPSDEPSRQPSDEPSRSPSDEPSLIPSDEPSLLPSDEPSISPSADPSSEPSLSLFPSSNPSQTRRANQCLMQPTVDATQNTCKSTNLEIVAENSARRGRMLVDPNYSTSFLSYIGPYGNSLTPENDGSYDQDYLGGYIIDQLDNDHVTLIGNAWKAFELDEPYTVTKNTRINFDFTFFKEAQGHAICLDNDLNEDTFGGTRIRCLMLAGKQFSRWDHVKKINLAEVKKGIATQSSTLIGGDAHRAIDGNIRQTWDSVSALNSISCTNANVQPWWQFEFADNDGDSNEFDLSEIIIYAGKNYPNSGNNLINFRVTICGLSSNSPSSSPTQMPSTLPSASDMPSSSPTVPPTSSPDSCAGTGYSQVGEDVRYGDVVVQDGIISVPLNRLGVIVRITLEGNTRRALGLGEVQIIGTLAENTPQTIDLSVFDLMPTQDDTIRYIAFVQDDDEFPSSGDTPLHVGASMSEFNNIRLYEGTEDNLDQVDAVWEPAAGRYFHEQGNQVIFANLPYHVGAAWKAQVHGSEVTIKECYNVDKTVSGFGPDSCGGGGTTGNVGFDNHIPETLAMSDENSNTLVVGYPNYVLFTPSSEPSQSPSISQNPSKAPTRAPTRHPTEHPTGHPTGAPNARRRLSSEPDRHGTVGIYSYLKGLDTNFPHQNNWETSAYLYGIIDDGEFGEGVAISDDGATIAVGSPGANMVQVFSLFLRDGEYSWPQKGDDIKPTGITDIKFGYRVGLSNDGMSLAVAAPYSNHPKTTVTNVGAIFVYDWDVTNGIWGLGMAVAYGTTSNSYLGYKGVAINPSSLSLHAIDVNSARHSFKLEGTCTDPNAVPMLSSLPHQFQCKCTAGFLAFNDGAGLTQILRPGFDDICVPAIESGNVSVTSTIFTVTVRSSVVVNPMSASLTRHEKDIEEDVPSPKLSVIPTIGDEEEQILTVTDLQPGYRYTLTMLIYDDLIQVGDKEQTLAVPIVLTCSGDTSTADLTGRPRNLKIDQRDGHVMFQFKDNSVCEEAFSFTRTNEVDEFLTDFSRDAESFTSDYFFSSSQPYGMVVRPELESADDLSVSQLEVGRLYSYCVRAVKVDHYMDSPYEGGSERRILTSSASACAAHKIEWEASINGLVTTEPNAGSLPIEDVTVSWFLLDESENILDCSGCSGAVTTDKGGVFELKIKAAHPILNNARDFPVKLFYSKTSPGSPPIQHDFLCNSGDLPCNTVNGDIHFLKHLQFEKELHIYDDTSIPFSGKVTIADTEGCVLPRAKVCAMHNDTSGEFEEIVCVDTDVNGIYELPIVAGATVHAIDLDYHQHIFENLSGIDYSPGLLILAETAPYFDNDFQDVSKAELRVEVVGGKCNKFLGKNSVLIKVANCVWEPEPFIQSDNIIDFPNIPAHIMNVEVVDVVDSDESTIFPIWQFFQGTNPLVRTIDLRDVEQIRADFVDEEGDPLKITNTGKEDEAAEATDKKQLSVIEGKEEAQLDTVRFQYDGVLDMKVVIDRSVDKYTCDKDEVDSPKPADFAGAQSLHVMEYMTPFSVDIYLKYTILEGVTCDIVDDDLRILVINNVGFDNFAGSDQFKDSITDDLTIAALSYCNPQADTQYCSPKDLFSGFDECVCQEEDPDDEICEDYCASCLRTCDSVNCVDASSLDEWATCLSESDFLTKGTFCNNECSDKCETSGCAFAVEHDINDEDENIGGARVSNLLFATGRPNIVAPYTKSMIFKVIGGNLEHKAAIFIEGLYSKGPGNSFALPTHEPIMILRDPPGGLSYAKYENIVTTVKVKSSSDETFLKNSIAGGADLSFDFKTFLCKGAGFGIVGVGFTFCDNPIDASVRTGIFSAKQDTGGDVLDISDENTNKFSTTWSFQTSEDPWTAGASSDVFVVPNLFVAVEEVFEVFWDMTDCAPIGDLAEDNPFPSQLIFDVNSPPSEQALAFYSRYHVEYVKLPDMKYSQKKQKELVDAMNNNDPVCCSVPKVNTVCPAGKRNAVCSDEAKAEEQGDLDALNDGVESWETSMKIEPDTDTLVNWMSGSGFGSKGLHDDSALKLDEGSDELMTPVVVSGLAPPDLVDGAQKLDVNLGNLPADADALKRGIRNAKRLQISGGGTKYEMTMQKVREDSKTTCRAGCKVVSETSGSLAKLKEALTAAFATGVKAYFDPLNLSIETTHTWHKSMTNSKETSVTVVLGDEDPGDELVVDMFYDTKYGTIVFETVAGRTKCPQELGTLPQEDPGIEISRFPSEYVFPNDEMVFEMELKNLGVGSESLFALYAQLNDDEGNLEIKVDGAPLFESRVYFSVASGVSLKKTLTIKKGPRMYINKPIRLTYESACMDDASLKNDLTVALSGCLDDVPVGLPDSTVANSMTISLYNTLDKEDNEIIKFVEPCPQIYWAGPLSRDRKFVVNTKSTVDQLINLKVTIFNPDFGTSTLKSKTADTANRLDHVYLKYRRLGEGEADWFPALINLDDGAVEIDFGEKYASEDGYGYSTLDWYHGGYEGKYEIMVETKCNPPLGGPVEIDSFRETILSGVIDVTRPERYGDPLPLRDEVLLGEEVAIIFTEPLDCGRPFTFEIAVDVIGTNYNFDNDNLHLICEGRKIAFQIDPGQVLEPEDLMGQTFSVTLGSINFTSRAVKDLHGNELEFNIYFERSFANLDLSAASTSFDFTLEMPCAAGTVAKLSNDIKDEIAAILDMTDSSRISINYSACHESEDEVLANVVILPLSARRQLKKGLRPSDKKHAHELYHELSTGSGKESDMAGRRLGAGTYTYSVAKMKILPSQADADKFKTHPDNQDRERELYRIASLRHEDNSGVNDFMIRELENEQRSTKKEMTESLHHLEEANGKERREEMDALVGLLRRMEEENTKDLEGTFMQFGIIMAVCCFVAGGLLVHFVRS